MLILKTETHENLVILQSGDFTSLVLIRSESTHFLDEDGIERRTVQTIVEIGGGGEEPRPPVVRKSPIQLQEVHLPAGDLFQIDAEADLMPFRHRRQVPCFTTSPQRMNS